ncbi:hypothetical protein JCM8547_000494 [Rhodosporidiobolus lusitaniae]
MAGSDFDDDLLALAEGTSKRKKSSSNKPNKRKRPAESDDDGSASDMDMSQSDSDAPAPSPRGGPRGRGGPKSAALVDSSDEDEDDYPAPTEDNPYPIEGVFKDEADRKRIMAMTEVEREDIIGTRKDEMSARQMRKEVAKMANKSGGRAAAADDSSKAEAEESEEEYEARETRSRKTTGTSKSKSEGIEKLKRSRAEKGKKKEKKVDSDDDDYEEGGKRRTRSSRQDDSSGSDMDQSGSDEEVRTDKKKGKGKKDSYDPASPEDLRKITVTRSKLAEMVVAPWFADWVEGAWVRYSVGPDHTGEMQYRLCQVIGVEEGSRPYRFDNVTTELLLNLQHGKSKKLFEMNAVSNSTFTDREYARVYQSCKVEGEGMPTPKEAAKTMDQLEKRSSYTLTEEDLAKQLAKKGLKKGGAQLKAQLRMERDLAVTSGDKDRLAEIDAQLAEIDKPAGGARETAAMLNERNRLSNREEVRRAEARGQEERRKQQEALAKGDPSVKVDASARVKTVPRMQYESRTNTPNPGTPIGSGRATPVNVPGAAAAAGTPKAKGGKIESAMADRVQLDVDLDF